jgi:FkbM family methyltransferase
MSRIFIDIGASYGQSTKVALNPIFGFDSYLLAEPSPECIKVLQKFRFKKVKIFEIGLSNRNGDAKFYGSGSLGASIYEDKKFHEGSTNPIVIQLVDATDFILKQTKPDDDLFIKMNCEGGEADILDSMISSGVVTRCVSLYIDFDIRKIPSQSSREVKIREDLKAQGINYVDPNHFPYQGAKGVEIWLKGEIMDIKPKFVSTISYRTFGYLKLMPRVKRLLKLIIPNQLKNSNLKYLAKIKNVISKLLAD